MRTNIYESAVMINAALDDELIDSIISRIKETIINNGGEIREIENWGRKRLAYVVKKSKIGYYAIFRFTAPSKIIAKLERFFSLDEQILRYLTIKLDGDAVEYLEKNKVAPVEEAVAPVSVPVAVEAEATAVKESEKEVDESGK
ncbi:MAG: 30S ribosomal protein S6 [Ignavibacteriaceae bacterium]|nr:30S ribosomal protein S6 [Ignavibacteriaceae bacterium]